MTDESIVSSLEDSRERRVADFKLDFGYDSNSVDVLAAAAPPVAWEFVTWAVKYFLHAFSKNSGKIDPISSAVICIDCLPKYVHLF